MEEQVIDKQQEGDKVSKQFDQNFKKLISLLGGESAFKKPTVPNSEVGGIVEELIKEKREEVIKQFKEGAKNLLNKKIEFDKECKKAEVQLKNTIIAKKKEFSDEMKKVFSLVENMQEIEKSYYSSIEEVKSK